MSKGWRHHNHDITTATDGHLHGAASRLRCVVLRDTYDQGSLYGTASGVSMADRWRAIHSDRVRGEMNSTVGGFLKKKMTWLKVREVGVGEDFSKSPREKWDACATLDFKSKSGIECVLCAPTVLSTIYILLVYQSKKLVWPWDSWNNHVSWRPSSSV